MSLILDALNKADNERKRQQHTLPGIATAHDNPAAYTDKPRIKVSWLFAAAAMFISLLTAVYYWGRTSQEPPGSSLPLTQQSALPANPQRATNRLQAASNLEQTEEAKPLNTTAASQRRSAAKPLSPTQQGIAQQYVNAGAAKQKGKADDIGNLYETRDAVPSPSTQAPGQSPAQIAAGHQQTLRQLRTQPSADKNSIHYYSHIGSVRELTYAMQQNIPTLMYQKHDYRQRGGGSTVTINGKTASKGNKVAEDVTVEDILADGVILKFQNKTFKMAAFSSWVNM